MNTARSMYPFVIFVTGLAVGVLWSPLERPRTFDGRTFSDVQSENRKFVAQTREMYGEDAAQFAKQFENMTIRIKKPPLDAYASPDGRFDIRLFGSDETIASDLYHPDSGSVVKLLNRHYSFSCDGQTYSCDFYRSASDSRMIRIVFNFSDGKGGELLYMDSNADGRWDLFADRSWEPSKVYERDGLCWKERSSDSLIPPLIQKRQ